MGRARLAFCVYLFLTHSPRKDAPLFFLSFLAEFFSLPSDFLSLDALPRGSRRQRHSAGDKSRISCYVGALAWKAALPPLSPPLLPLLPGGGNLSLADDPLKRICPRTRQCTTLRAATREVIQRHATRLDTCGIPT